jgi:hypothetical protein
MTAWTGEDDSLSTWWIDSRYAMSADLLNHVYLRLNC